MKDLIECACSNMRDETNEFCDDVLVSTFMNVFVDINLDHSPSHRCMLGTNYI